jgi:FkbM family methyltransferase
MTSQVGICIKIAGDVQVCVPDDIQLMTPYVLQEQLDWFEDEIKFLRGTIGPGSHVIDIGANYGVYALTAAKLVGPEGRVWAFEPFPATANWLRRSAEANGYANLNVIEAAVSSQSGRGPMATSDNSELNRLMDQAAGLVGALVPLTTLDVSSQEFDWSRVDFVKIDAEGHEISVIEGGRHFFETQAPLVMCEIKAGDKVDLRPLQRMESLGYSAYRLVPGLDVLAPFHSSESIDGYQLNLFCCKPDRVELLASSGHLVREPVAGCDPGNGWSDFLQQFAYGRVLTAILQRKVDAGSLSGGGVYLRALNAYARARSMTESMATRYACLQSSYRELEEAVSRFASFSRLLSLARVARDLGQRQRAVTALQQLIGTLETGRTVHVSEPFLVPSPEFEQIDPGDQMANWMVSSVLHQYETLRAFSSYFFSQDTTATVSKLQELGFSTAAMDRRLELVRRRHHSLQPG